MCVCAEEEIKNKNKKEDKQVNRQTSMHFDFKLRSTLQTLGTVKFQKCGGMIVVKRETYFLNLFC